MCKFIQIIKIMAKKFDYLLGKLRQVDSSEVPTTEEIYGILSRMKIEILLKFNNSDDNAGWQLYFKIPDTRLIEHLQPCIQLMRYQTERKSRNKKTDYVRRRKGWGMACSHFIDGENFRIEGYEFSRYQIGKWQTIEKLSYEELINLFFEHYVDEERKHWKMSGRSGKQIAFFGFAIRVNNPAAPKYDKTKYPRSPFLFSDIAKIKCVLNVDENVPLRTKIGIGIL